MTLLKQLLTEANGIYEPIEGDLNKINKTVKLSKGKIVKSGKDTLAVKQIDESDALKDVLDNTDDGDSDSDAVETAGNAVTADKLDVGADVKIKGTSYDGQEGTIESFGRDKKFVIVKLSSGLASFHSSDVVSLDSDEDEEDDEDEDTSANSDATKFYVAFYDTTRETSWIGKVSRENGGMWHEKPEQGKPDIIWGKEHEKYMTADDIVNLYHRKFPHSIKIEGPFYELEDASEFISDNWGEIRESLNIQQRKLMEGLDSFHRGALKALNNVLKRLNIMQADDHPPFSNAGEKAMKAVYRTLYGALVDGGPTEFVKAWDKAAHDDVDAFDEFADMLFQDLGVKDFPGFSKKLGLGSAKFKPLKESAVAEFESKPRKEVAGLANFKKELAELYGEHCHLSIDGNIFNYHCGRNLVGRYDKTDKVGHIVTTKAKNISEALNADGYHVTLKNPSFKQNNTLLIHGDPREYLHDESNFTARKKDKNPMLVTFQKKAQAEKFAKDLNAVVVTTPSHSYRLVNKKTATKKVDKEEIKEAAHEGEKIYTDFTAWKNAVKATYPELAHKFKFNGRSEKHNGPKAKGVLTISAEIPGVDRCYGVWYPQKDEGSVLFESAFGPMGGDQRNMRGSAEDKKDDASFKGYLEVEYPDWNKSEGVKKRAEKLNVKLSKATDDEADLRITGSKNAIRTFLNNSGWNLSDLRKWYPELNESIEIDEIIILEDFLTEQEIKVQALKVATNLLGTIDVKKANIPDETLNKAREFNKKALFSADGQRWFISLFQLASGKKFARVIPPTGSGQNPYFVEPTKD